MKNKGLFLLGALALFLQISCSGGQQQPPQTDNVGNVNNEQELGTGINEERDEMDTCTGAAGPRFTNGVFSPGTTASASIDDVNGGYCGLNINTPGIWWWIEGTGEIIRTSTCHIQTTIKVKISVFTGSCDDLICVTGGEEKDYECPILKVKNDSGEWDTTATALNFPTVLGQQYYILVQQQQQAADDTTNTTSSASGDVWLNFRPPIVPQNDNCVDAIGPVPRDLTRISSTIVDASKSDVPAGYCGRGHLPSLYPGTWFQVIGTGEPLTVMACGPNNFDGYTFSVYGGDDGTCDTLECIFGQYTINVEDPGKCTFGQITRPLTKYIFDTVDRNRYYVYVHFARTIADKPTGDFRFYVDDGSDGKGSSSGAHIIQYEKNSTAAANNNGDYNNKEGEIGDGNGGGDTNVDNNGSEEESSGVQTTQSCFFCFVIASWMISFM